jgi:hypothetical protein
VLTRSTRCPAAKRQIVQIPITRARAEGNRLIAERCAVVLCLGCYTVVHYRDIIYNGKIESRHHQSSCECGRVSLPSLPEEGEDSVSLYAASDGWRVITLAQYDEIFATNYDRLWDDIDADPEVVELERQMGDLGIALSEAHTRVAAAFRRKLCSVILDGVGEF